MLTTVCALAVLAAAPAGRAGPEKKDIDPAKLVGVWEPVDIKGESPPLVLPLEFTKDGKAQYAGAGDPVVWGRYKVLGGRLEVTRTDGKKESSQSYDITKLTDADLVLSFDSGKKTWALKRKK